MISPATEVHVTIAGAVIALLIAAAIGATLWWMLHPPSSFVQRLAAEAESSLERMVGSIIVVFSPEINSSHMMALAVRLAHGQKSALHAVLRWLSICRFIRRCFKAECNKSLTE